MAPPFEEDVSDIDSISLTSTQLSDVEAEYDVEKIISEERDKDSGEMLYLVKWEGYPLHLSSWEPAENLLADQILSDWQRDKEAVASGLAEPFDMGAYWEIKEKVWDEKEERRLRRIAKRRRLGLPSRSGSVADRSAGDVAENSEEYEVPRGRQKQVEEPTPKREGVAQNVMTSSTKQNTLIVSSDESGGDSEGEDSLPSNKKTSAVSSGKVSKTVAKPVASEARGSTTNTASVTPAFKVTQKRPSVRSTAAAKKIAAAAALAPSAAASSTKLTKRTQPSSSARKSAPSTASAFGNNAAAPKRLPVLPFDPPKRKAAVDPFIGFGKKAPECKGRKVSDSNPKAHRFSNLAEENRVRKFSAKEAAPDPSVLQTFNFATGKYDEPAMEHRAANLCSSSAANNVFGRREAPAPARQRSVSPPSVTAADRTAPTLPRDNTTTHTRVCWDWRNGDCHNEHCSFAHHYITCPFWRQGSCYKKEIDCQFDHKEEGRDPIFRSANEARKSGHFYPGDNVNVNPSQLPRPAVAASPSTEKPQVIFLKPKDVPCQFWARGTCYKPAHECKFTHHDTGAPSDPKKITCGYWSAQGCISPKCKFAHHETAYSTLGPRNESSITCSYWLAGQCQNDRCELAHHKTGCRSLGPLPLAPTDAGAMSPGIVANREPSPAPASVVRAGVAPIANMIPASRRPSLPAPQADRLPFINDVVLEVSCGSGDFQSAAQLICATQLEAAMLNDSIGLERRLHMQHMIDAMGFQTQFDTTLKQALRFPAGDIICENSRRDHAKALAQKLRQSSSCGIIHTPALTLLVYPTGTKQWESLTREGDTTSPHAVLKFKLLPALPTKISTLENVTSAEDVTQNGPAKIPTSKDVASKNIGGSATEDSSFTPLSNVDMERLIRITDVKVEDKVFLMMPPSKADEMQRIASAFKKRFKQPDYANRDTHISTLQEKGEWDTIAAKPTRTAGGLLIVHPEIPLWKIPHLAGMLHYSGLRVFSVGVDAKIPALERCKPTFSCRRLFPMGDVVFVTDDVFVETPEKVLRIINEVNRQNRGKPPGASRTKIAARPGVRQWFMRLVTEHERGEEDPRWMALLMAIWELCPADKDDEEYPGNPSETADLISIPAEQLPTFQALLETNKAKATDYVVNWFDGWAYMNASNYRRFTVCHEEPGTGSWGLDENYNKVLVGAEADPRGWAKEFNHVLVTTPEQWLKDKTKLKK